MHANISRRKLIKSYDKQCELFSFNHVLLSNIRDVSVDIKLFGVNTLLNELKQTF